MTAIMNRMTILIAFTIWCLLQSSIYCFPTTPTATSTTAVKAVSHTPQETLDAFKNAIIDQLEEELRHVEDKDIEDINQAIKDLRRMKKIDEKKHRKYSEHNSNHENGKKDDTPPSNTVVTTIFIVATETPTTIYSGNGGNAAKQQGSSQDHQVGDPNSTSPSNNQTEAEITEQMLRDQSAYHKLVTALSIVGGIAAISLVTAGLIYTRIRIRRKKRLLDLEKADSTSSSSPPTPPHQHRPRPPSLPDGHFSSVTFDDGNSTVIGPNQQHNPFADSNSIHPYKSNPNLQSNDLLPPLLPVHLEPRSYITYRQNQTLSMLSQTTATALPSAPTAKELGALTVENPFTDDDYESTSEEEYTHQQQHGLYPSIASTRNDYELEQEHERTTHTPTAAQAEPHRPTLLQQQALQKSESSFSSLPPPPAYTPSAAPSAPPLYALPITTTTFEEQQRGEEDTLRRHSISSCSIASSSSRPLFLRRGSGSRAHISSTVS